MKLKLFRKTLEANGIKSFFWQPENKVKYLPGQYFYITQPEIAGKDYRGITRHFTLSSSPTETELRITTNIRPESEFKLSLDKLKVGDVVDGEGPNGTFILDEFEKGDHVLIAGGIGITPFRSFIKYNIDNKLTKTKIHLLYSVSTPQEILFKKELDEWTKTSNIKIDVTVTKPKESKTRWNGLSGRIDSKLIGKLTSHLVKPTFWLCGPPGLVEVLEKTLDSLKISSDRIRSEKFTGY